MKGIMCYHLNDYYIFKCYFMLIVAAFKIVQQILPILSPKFSTKNRHKSGFSIRLIAENSPENSAASSFESCDMQKNPIDRGKFGRPVVRTS